MNEEMVDINKLSKALEYRRISKAIQQISYKLNIMEKSINVDDLSKAELQELNQFYEETFDSLEEIYLMLKEQNENKNNTN